MNGCVRGYSSSENPFCLNMHLYNILAQPCLRAHGPRGRVVGTDSDTGGHGRLQLVSNAPFAARPRAPYDRHWRWRAGRSRSSGDVFTAPVAESTSSNAAV